MVSGINPTAQRAERVYLTTYSTCPVYPGVVSWSSCTGPEILRLDTSPSIFSSISLTHSQYQWTVSSLTRGDQRVDVDVDAAFFPQRLGRTSAWPAQGSIGYFRSTAGHLNPPRREETAELAGPRDKGESSDQKAVQSLTSWNPLGLHCV